MTALVAALLVPAFIRAHQPYVAWNFVFERINDRVTHVTPGSPAAQAGIKVGDLIDTRDIPLIQRPRVNYPAPDTTLCWGVTHDGVRRIVPLTTSLTPSRLNGWVATGAFVATFVFLAVGAMLVFARPCRMTWWLWAYCVGFVPAGPALEAYIGLPDAVYFVYWFGFRALAEGFMAFMLLPFVMRFPHDRVEGWRCRIERPVWVLFFGAIVYYLATTWWIVAHDFRYGPLFNDVPALCALALVAAILLVTYSQSHGLERQRLKWAVFGITFSLLSQAFVFLPGAMPQGWALASLATMASITMPLSMAYATLRHRLIDVHFVMNRAIVYGSLAGILLAVVSLVDWVTSRLLSESHLALFTEATATIAVGFALDKLHAVLERWTDRLFFRARHEAEEHLKRVAASLPFARHESAIDQALVDEPVQTLHLASAAIFDWNRHRGAFVRGRAIGWGESDASFLEEDEPLVRYLYAERAPLRVRHDLWRREDVPHGNAAPALVVPVVCRAHVRSFIVYGAHQNGTDLDPDEVLLIAALAPPAAAAFDHASLEALHEHLSEMKIQVDELLEREGLAQSPAPSA